MSDQQAPPQNGDTPAVAGPTEAPGTAQDQPHIPEGYVPEQRYKDVQAEYTRSQQAYKEAENREQWYRTLVTTDDPDIQRQAADILGIELADSEEYAEPEPDEFTDPDPYDQRIRALEERWSSQEQQAQAEQEQQILLSHAETQLEQLGLPRTEDPAELETRQIIFERALSLPRLPPQPGQPREGLLDIKAAHEQFQAWMDLQMKGWAKTKRAPYVPAGGLPANEVPDPGHGHTARMNRALLRLRNDMGDEE
jgi:hypothetical protein